MTEVMVIYYECLSTFTQESWRPENLYNFSSVTQLVNRKDKIPTPALFKFNNSCFTYYAVILFIWTTHVRRLYCPKLHNQTQMDLALGVYLIDQYSRHTVKS